MPAEIDDADRDGAETAVAAGDATEATVRIGAGGADEEAERRRGADDAPLTAEPSSTLTSEEGTSVSDRLVASSGSGNSGPERSTGKT